jgi:hypothetical protein
VAIFSLGTGSVVAIGAVAFVVAVILIWLFCLILDEEVLAYFLVLPMGVAWCIGSLCVVEVVCNRSAAGSSQLLVVCLCLGAFLAILYSFLWLRWDGTPAGRVVGRAR